MSQGPCEVQILKTDTALLLVLLVIKLRLSTQEHSAR